jgi:hypothetical protein
MFHTCDASVCDRFREDCERDVNLRCIAGIVIRLRTCDIWPVSLQGYQNVCGLDVVLLRDFLNDLIRQQRGVVRSKRGVSSECDALLIA